MADLELDTPIEHALEPDTTDNKPNVPDLYKKWHTRGFLSVKPLLHIGKFRIDIGAMDEKKTLTGHTEVFVDSILFATYLRAVANGQGIMIYRANPRTSVPTDEGVTFYGGGKIDGKPISRIFKSHYWAKGKNEYDINAFVFKAGHFEANESSSGAFMPNMDKPLSTDFIKMTRQEMAELSYRVDLCLNSFAARTPNWFEI